MIFFFFKNFLGKFWNEFQHKSICFSFIATFNMYIRKQYRKVRWSLTILTAHARKTPGKF